MKIRCVITDDEPVARKGIASYVEKVDFLELVGVCEDAVSLNNLLQQQPVDLLLLDIEMPYMTGLELLSSIPNPPKVIFITAYEQYAIKGFELQVLDYLLKPVSFDRFLKAANRALESFRQTIPPDSAYIFIKSNEKLVKIFWEDILYLEAMENYVNIYTDNARHIIHATLRSVVESINSTDFVQTHKSYVVNAKKITGIDGNLVEMGTATVPFSRGMKEAAMEKILRNRLFKK
ncbi:LytTR family DNA-binding domain-containing protein [Chitinophaga sp. sic0106]|uniref:LytR/AlgR family response regulator transcription factor n=1 Tax=Chitinophaga sp. sic0106 TaxID=2854785 RepID=UPI001C458FE2|nr:LytTR family DNA-binding domain-containing protein [Chitinophaga sp. sic0106]MBV7531733.1 LytTR family DNA-binding domain-containing protein [Chitinophaga sp. sic0106]